MAMIPITAGADPAPSSGWSKDRRIETLEGKVGELEGKVGELEGELKHVKKVRDTLKGELAMQEMYRRLDCVRVAQKYLEATRHDAGDLIGTAANIASFIENGASERDKGPDRAPLS